MLGFIQYFKSKKTTKEAQKRAEQYEYLEKLLIKIKLEERKSLMQTISMMKQTTLPDTYRRYMEFKKLSLNYVRDYYSNDKRLTKTEAIFVKNDLVRKQYEVLNHQINKYKAARMRLKACNQVLKSRGY